ncbi:hypothetical protein Ptr902_04331 [Pyrenophora tritici-repentis]|nr:hypothetical protein Ptr902_04331 [Pyrenophora tritici-repentis]
MAITEAHPGIKVDIHVGGVPLTEYDDDDEQAQTSEKTVTKYIEATSGAEFAVNCEVTRPLPKHSLLVDVFLDGQRKRGTYMDKPGITSRISIEGCNYTERQRWFLQKFCFSGLDTVDSTESTVPDKLMNGLKSVGNIRVEVFHVMNLRDVTERTKLPERQDAVALGKVPEKALKGRTLSHHAT